jgi:lactate dehydrogenase-like 2-hydroxyacid dehydrogenase
VGTTVKFHQAVIHIDDFDTFLSASSEPSQKQQQIAAHLESSDCAGTRTLRVQARAWQKVELIAARSMGYDHIDLDECTLSNVSGTDANTVAEHTFALMLALSRRLNEVREANKRSKFPMSAFRALIVKIKP